jgi:hypothetical protein
MPGSKRSMHQSHKSKLKTNTRLREDQTGNSTDKNGIKRNTVTTCFIDLFRLHRDLPKKRSTLLNFAVINANSEC